MNTEADDPLKPAKGVFIGMAGGTVIWAVMLLILRGLTG